MNGVVICAQGIDPLTQRLAVSPPPKGARRVTQERLERQGMGAAR